LQLHPVKLLAGSGVENALVGGEGGQPPSGPVEATLLAFKQKLTVVQHTHDLRGSFDGHADGTGALICRTCVPSCKPSFRARMLCHTLARSSAWNSFEA
jgi:hypothetical protein